MRDEGPDSASEELASAESEARFRTLVEESPVAFGVFRDLRIEYVNSRYAEIFRTTPQALIGVPVFEQFAPQARQETTDGRAREPDRPFPLRKATEAGSGAGPGSGK